MQRKIDALQEELRQEYYKREIILLKEIDRLKAEVDQKDSQLQMLLQGVDYTNLGPARVLD